MPAKSAKKVEQNSKQVGKRSSLHKKLVIHPPIDDARLLQIRGVASSLRVVNPATDEEALREIADADAFFGKLTPGLLAAAKRLQWVQSPTASLEHYVFDELIAHPLVLTNMRGLFSDVIADQVMGYIICFARNLHIYVRNQLLGLWAPQGGEQERVTFASGPGMVTAIDRCHLHLADMTLGVVGLGSIGGEIARRAAAFGMRVVAVDPQPREKIAEVEKVWRPEQLQELLAAADFVVVAAPHTPHTAKMFRLAQFQSMKGSAYFINIGRGAIVDLKDLHAALEGGEIAGAALDVYEQEPLPSDHPLWRLPNVILTPHIAGYSPRIAERHLQVLLDNVQRFTSGQPLRNVVNKAEWF